MAAKTVYITITDNSTRSTDDIKARIQHASHRTQQEIVELENWMNRIATGIQPSSVDVCVSTQSAPTAATGTYTCAGVLESDTVTIAGSTLTAQDLREKFTSVCVADSSGSLNSTYFLFNTPTVGYYVWLNVNSAGVDPAVALRTGVPVAVATNASNTTVATAVKNAVDALADVTATVSSATVTVVNDSTGAAADAVDGAVPTGFTITVTRQGANSPGANKFAMNTSDTATGASLATAINTQATINTYVTGANVAGVVTVSSNSKSALGNLVTTTSSNGTRLLVSGATLTGGAGALGSDTVTTYNYNS